MLSAPDTDGGSSEVTIAEGTLEDACGLEPGWVCEWVYDATDGNEQLAQLARWFVDIPLRIIVILLAAWVISRLAHRAVDRLVENVVGRDPTNTFGLQRLGLQNPTLLAPDEDEQRDRAARAAARSRSISGVLGSTVSVLVWTVAGIIVMGELGVQLGPFIASAGIAGVALGFGAQSLVRDCISGLFILIEDQYGVGDVVDVGEATGTVEEIHLRTTTLRSLDGTVWHVPNGEITRVGNMSQLWSIALIDVDVAYDADLDAAQSVLQQTADDVCAEPDWAPDIVEAPMLLGVERLGADGVTLRLVVKCAPGSQWALQRHLRQRIKGALDAAGIEIPFPQRTVWIRSDGPSDA